MLYACNHGELETCSSCKPPTQHITCTCQHPETPHFYETSPPLLQPHTYALSTNINLFHHLNLNSPQTKKSFIIIFFFSASSQWLKYVHNNPSMFKSTQAQHTHHNNTVITKVAPKHNTMAAKVAAL